MKKEQIIEFLKLPTEQKTTGVFLRSILLNDILGEDIKTVLYYYGKTIAEQLDITSIEDAMEQYTLLNFGQITLDQVKKNSYLFQTTSLEIDVRMNLADDSEFSLETGFMAGALQKVLEQTAEGQFQIDLKNGTIGILVQTDTKN